MAERKALKKDEKTIAGMFDRIVERYDLMNRVLSGLQDQRWRRSMAESIQDDPKAILDLATGTGDVLFEAARQHPYADLVGIDISQRMLHRAYEKAKNLGLRVDFQQMSALKLEFPEESFDAVTIAFGIRNVENRETLLKEVERVLRPGGRLLVLEFFAHGTSWLQRISRFYVSRILPQLGGLVSDRPAYRYLADSIAEFVTPEILKHEMSSAGLDPKQTRVFFPGSCALLRADKPADAGKP